MFESIIKFFKKVGNKEEKTPNSKEAAKERLHLVLMQDRANVSADFLELMKQEIIEVIKKYIEVDESAIDVRLTNKENEDGTNGAPALYANIPIINIKNETRKLEKNMQDKEKNNQNIKIENTIENNDQVEENKKQEKEQDKVQKDEGQEIKRQEKEQDKDNEKSEEIENKEEDKETQKQENDQKENEQNEKDIKDKNTSTSKNNNKDNHQKNKAKK